MTSAEEPKLIKQQHAATKKLLTQELISRNLNNTQVLPTKSVEVK